MRKIRVFSIIVFVAAVVLFGLYKKQEILTTDNTGPEITMDNGVVKVSCSDGTDKLLEGIKAKDAKDGDVTDSLIIESMSNFIKKGKREMTIAAFDSDNNVKKETRTVAYTDYKSPKFSLESPLKFPLKTPDILGTLNVQDVLDGNLTGNIKMSGEYSVKPDTAGDYPMIFIVSNSAGDVVKLPVTIQIYDPAVEAQCPQLSLTQYITYIPVGSTMNLWDYLQQIVAGEVRYTKAEDGNLHAAEGADPAAEAITPEHVQITHNVDTNTPGAYEVTYQFTDNGDNEGRTGTVRLIVVVEK